MTYTPTLPARRKSERGTTFILFTLLCTLLLIPIAGLAIDVSVMYLMKAKLSAAVDAAALATARGLSVGTSLAQQTAAATATGNAYFSANLPAGTMGATVVGGAPTITVTSTANNTLQATVQATITVPMLLLRLLGFQTSTMRATGQASRRVSNIILVLDRSYSMVQASACPTLVSSAQSFVNQFVDGRDTLALITFQSTANRDYPARNTFKSVAPTLNSVIAQLQCTGYTTTASALKLAYDEIKSLNQPLANNVIVLFTDGRADAFVADFTSYKKTQVDTRYDWQNTGSMTSVPASACDSNSLSGVLINVYGNPDPTGYTAGIFQNTPEPIWWVSPNSPFPFPAASVAASSKCNFANTGNNGGFPNDTMAIRTDIKYLPATDIYSNPLTGHWPTQGSTYPSGAAQPRIDTPVSITNAALNAADAMASKIRSDANFTPTIYTIGLGGTPSQQIDTDFLERVANDPRSTSYNGNQQTGLFIYCTQAGLASAFQQIASQILRLSK